MPNAARTDSVLRTLAHLLAAHANANPKQAKEPIVDSRVSKATTRNLGHEQGLLSDIRPTTQLF